ncbi:hypothetical protein N431DRAFT_129405 [Stipitochalara longipes BDJ]|nr:hypothetical protein N431DRAFT_129405 [Stipitochalara longipes BDJ]
MSRSFAFDVEFETAARCTAPPHEDSQPAGQPTSLNQPLPHHQRSLPQLLFTFLIFSLSFRSLYFKREEKKVEMAGLQTKLTSFIPSLAIDKPTLSRTDSASSFASDASCNNTEGETELQPWKYGHRRAYSEQDEVKRKRAELAEKRRRASNAAWREFWP